MDITSVGFPFRIDEIGRMGTQSGDENIRAKIVEILLTAPGERVNLPDFGCGLRDLVFDPNNEILAATSEFAVNRALQQWMGDQIIVETVDVRNREGELSIEIVYLRRDQLERSKVKIAF